jgi:hypothetical protein
MKDVRVTLPSGQVVFVDAKTAKQVESRKLELAQMSARIDRELRASRMLPQEHRNQLSGWIGKTRTVPC